MGDRITLHNKLKAILGSDQVYFQPPETVKMEYPAIIYKEDIFRSDYADNTSYLIHTGYTITLITKKHQEDTILKILKLPKCMHDRQYISDNLYHNAFTMFY